MIFIYNDKKNKFNMKNIRIKYSSPKIVVHTIEIENTLASSSIATITPLNDDAEIKDIWLHDEDSEFIIKWNETND